MSRLTINTIDLDQNGDYGITSPSNNVIIFKANSVNVFTLNGDSVVISGGLTGNNLIAYGNITANAVVTNSISNDVNPITVINMGLTQANGTIHNISTANNLIIENQTLFLKDTWRLVNSINLTGITTFNSPILTGYKAIRIYGFNMQVGADGNRFILRVGTDGTYYTSNYNWFTIHGNATLNTWDNLNNAPSVPNGNSAFPLLEFASTSGAGTGMLTHGADSTATYGGTVFECLITNLNNNIPSAPVQISNRAIWANAGQTGGKTLGTWVSSGMYSVIGTNINCISIFTEDNDSAGGSQAMNGHIIIEGLK
jgi:hypothetical protein